MRIRHWAVLGAMIGGVYSYLPPVLALLVLIPVDYGRFSLVYLVYAFALSACMSLVNEPWARGGGPVNDVVLGSYNSITSIIALSCGGVGATLAYFINLDGWAVAGAAIATTSGTLRFGLRYHHLARRRAKHVFFADAFGFAVTVAVYVASTFALEISSAAAVFWSWGIGAVVAVSPLRLSTGKTTRPVKAWKETFGKHVRPLMRDALLTDLSGIGGPYLLAPILGLVDFGIYRALANLTAPARMVIAGLRPYLARAQPKQLASKMFTLTLILLSALAGVLTGTALLLVDQIDLNVGSLAAVSVYAFPLAALTGSTIILQLYSAIARIFASPAALLRARLVQSVLVGSLPILGALTFGLAGAIWSFVAAFGVSAAVWFFFTTRELHRHAI